MTKYEQTVPPRMRLNQQQAMTPKKTGKTADKVKVPAESDESSSEDSEQERGKSDPTQKPKIAKSNTPIAKKTGTYAKETLNKESSKKLLSFSSTATRPKQH